MPITLTTTADKELTRIRALLYGDSGIGKTTSLGTLPEDRTLIVAAERGTLVLRNRAYAVARVATWEDVREVVRALQGGDIEGRKFTVIAFDSLSEINEICKRQIVEKDRPGLITERTRGKTDKPAGIYDDLLSQEDWGLVGNRMAGFISACCHLPMNVIFTSLASWKEDKATGAQLRTPDLNGRLATEVPAYFDLVLFMESKKDGEGGDTRVWRTFNDGRVIAKDASGVGLDPYIEPDWTKLFSRILNGNGGTK